MRFSRFGTARLAPLLLLAAWPLAASETLSPFDVARIRTVGSIAVSPDGSRIAYTLSVPRRVIDEEDGAAWQELHVAGKDGVSHPFVTGAVNVADIAWTKDGREISFVAKRGKDEHRCLWAIAADGGEARKLLCHEGDIGSYSFAPDGKRVAFLAGEEAPKSMSRRVTIMDADSGKIAARIENPGKLGQIAWSQDGKNVAYVAAADVNDPSAGRLMEAPVRLVLYPGEGHGNRLAAHRLDYNLRTIQWMEHYLKGPGSEPPPYEIEYEAPGEVKSP